MNVLIMSQDIDVVPSSDSDGDSSEGEDSDGESGKDLDNRGKGVSGANRSVTAVSSLISSLCC